MRRLPSDSGRERQTVISTTQPPPPTSATLEPLSRQSAHWNTASMCHPGSTPLWGRVRPSAQPGQLGLPAEHGCLKECGPPRRKVSLPGASDDSEVAGRSPGSGRGTQEGFLTVPREDPSHSHSRAHPGLGEGSGKGGMGSVQNRGRRLAGAEGGLGRVRRLPGRS